MRKYELDFISLARVFRCLLSLLVALRLAIIYAQIEPFLRDPLPRTWLPLIALKCPRGSVLTPGTGDTPTRLTCRIVNFPSVGVVFFCVLRRCPVPQSLRHSMNPYKDYPEGLEIAPFVYLYFEPWPEQELPMPQPKAPTEKPETGSGGSSSLAVRAVGDRRGKTQSAESAVERGTASGPYFSVTLCVGKYIFSSILGVHIRVLSSIFNDWLRAVPLKEQEGGKLVRFRLRDVAPIASTQPVADRAL